MAANHPLPDPEYIGSDGYVWVNQFDPALPAVPATHPSIMMDTSSPLAEAVLSYLGVEKVNKECFQVRNSTPWQRRIDFSIPLLGGAGQPLQLSVYGNKAINQVLVEKYVVVACVNLLAAVGHELPTYSSILIQSMDEEALYYNVEHLCLTKAQNNSVHLVADADMTYAGCSFEAIFDQCMHRCGYAWEYASESRILTTEGYQHKMVATRKGSTGDPSLIVLSRPCCRPAEATESALCTALTYISDSCGYKIGDLHYTQCMIRRFQHQNPYLPPVDP